MFFKIFRTDSLTATDAQCPVSVSLCPQQPRIPDRSEWSSATSRFYMVHILRSFSAHHGLKEWLTDPSCQAEPICLFLSSKCLCTQNYCWPAAFFAPVSCYSNQPVRHHKQVTSPVTLWQALDLNPHMMYMTCIAQLHGWGALQQLSRCSWWVSECIYCFMKQLLVNECSFAHGAHK